MSKEIRRRIIAGNRKYFANIKLLQSKLLFKATKMMLYKTLIRPLVCDGAKSWVLSKINNYILKIFERKIVQKKNV